jgi:CRP-like cAMP-binding protein
MGIILFKLEAGHVFGIDSFFTGLARKMSARSVESCTLLEINRESFIKLIKENEEEYEKFSNIKDGILF